MPYPKVTDPAYCAGSLQPIPDYNPDKQWHRCPHCQRPLVERGKTRTFWPHVNDRRRARRGDAVQESLIAYGLNQKERWRA